MTRTLIAALAAFLLTTTAAFAQAPQASAISLTHASSIAKACVDAWETQPCIKALSESNYVLLSNYGADLQNKGQEAAAETLKQDCAATTAAMKVAVPAYAMRSAIVACANAISTIADQTKILPDPSHFQLMVIPTPCLEHSAQCPMISEQFKQYK